jgi:DNA-binding IclR family transcriptional regulator
MEELMMRTGETVHLSVWDQREVVYIDKVESPNPIRLHSTLGGRAPAHAVASGLALLAFQDSTTQAQVVSTPLKGFTGRTITSRGQLQRRLDGVRRNGYAFSAGAWFAGSAGVAAPVRSHTGDVIAAISTAGPAERIVNRVPELARLVRDAAARVSHALGDSTIQRPTASGMKRHRPTRGAGAVTRQPDRISGGDGRSAQANPSRRRP